MEALKFRTSFAGSIGNLLEWYDFAVFGYFAPFIGAQFFPTDDPMSALITRSAFSLPAILHVPLVACCSARSEIGWVVRVRFSFPSF